MYVDLISYAKAPGKVIITGEHFVVYGSLALVAAIERGVIVGAQKSAENQIVSKTFGTQIRHSKFIPRGFQAIIRVMEKTLLHLESGEKVSITINSNIPKASGLGSSSAIVVATAAAIARLHGQEINTNILFDLAMEGEKILHGNPSGIDVAIAIHGGILLFRTSEEPVKLTINSKPEIVVGVSGKKRRTSEMIKKFGMVRSSMPRYFDSMIHASTILTRSAVDALKSGDQKTLGAIMNFYNSTLSYYGLGTRITDDLIEQCMASGALGAKVTGGGGGGSIIALAPQDGSRAILETLRDLGFEAFPITLSESGVRSWDKD